MRANVWAALLAIVAGTFPAAAAASCAGLSAGAISAKFSEAAAACGDAKPVPAAPPATAFSVETPPTASVAYAAPRPHRAAARRGQRVAGGNSILAVSRHYRIDPLLLDAIVARESAYRPGAVSHKGALGLMQIMPGTARGLGIRDPNQLLTDPALNLSAGALYLKQLQGEFGNDVPAVLAAYNAGPGAVQRYGRAVPYAETRTYVSTIMTRYHSARRGRK